jgi:hypothetical protein
MTVVIAVVLPYGRPWGAIAYLMGAVFSRGRRRGRHADRDRRERAHRQRRPRGRRQGPAAGLQGRRGHGLHGRRPGPARPQRCATSSSWTSRRRRRLPGRRDVRARRLVDRAVRPHRRRHLHQGRRRRRRPRRQGRGRHPRGRPAQPRHHRRQRRRQRRRRRRHGRRPVRVLRRGHRRPDRARRAAVRRHHRPARPLADVRRPAAGHLPVPAARRRASAWSPRSSGRCSSAAVRARSCRPSCTSARTWRWSSPAVARSSAPCGCSATSPRSRTSCCSASSSCIGLVAGYAIGFTSEYYTSDHYNPVKKLACQSETGPATVIIGGIADGMLSTGPLGAADRRRDRRVLRPRRGGVHVGGRLAVGCTPPRWPRSACSPPPVRSSPSTPTARSPTTPAASPR